MAISNFNRNTTRIFTKQPTDGAPYVKLESLYKSNGPDKIYDLCGMYVSTAGRYGNHPVLFTDKAYINAPQHMLQTVQDIMQTPEVVQQINDGTAGFKIYEYQSNGKTCYSVEFVDIDLPY